jgi:hypothetical protein
MKRTRSSNEQIVATVKEKKAGMATPDSAIAVMMMCAARFFPCRPTGRHPPHLAWRWLPKNRRVDVKEPRSALERGSSILRRNRCCPAYLP